MSDRSRNAVIGFFALGGMFCLAALIMLFGETRGLFQQEYPVQAKFGTERPPSIRSGTEVSIAGVPVGSVGKVSLVKPEDPSLGLRAELWIANGFQVPEGSVARVVIPLMGQPTVDIKPPSPLAGPTVPLPKDGTGEIRGEVVNPLESVIDPKLMGTLDKTLEQIGELASALTPAANAFTDLLETRTIDEVESPQAVIEGMTANLYTAVQRLYNVLTHFDTVLGDPNVQSNVKLTLDNFREASEGVKIAVEDLKVFSQQAQAVATAAQNTMTHVDQTISITQGHIDTLGRKLTTDADKLSRLLDYFLSVGQQMAEGEGTAAMLLRDTRLYEELLLTFQRLGAAASEMQTLIRQWQAQGMGVRLR
jgi:ABC-type transporter Mla subunit MlaD